MTRPHPAADHGTYIGLTRGRHDLQPEGAAAPNAPGSGEGGSRQATAQGYSAAAEARPDSGSRTGRRNAGVGSDGAGASAERSRNRGRLDRPLAPGERLTADGDRISVRQISREA